MLTKKLVGEMASFLDGAPNKQQDRWVLNIKIHIFNYSYLKINMMYRLGFFAIQVNSVCNDTNCCENKQIVYLSGESRTSANEDGRRFIAMNTRYTCKHLMHAKVWEPNTQIYQVNCSYNNSLLK